MLVSTASFCPKSGGFRSTTSLTSTKKVDNDLHLKRPVQRVVQNHDRTNRAGSLATCFPGPQENIGSGEGHQGCTIPQGQHTLVTMCATDGAPELRIYPTASELLQSSFQQNPSRTQAMGLFVRPNFCPFVSKVFQKAIWLHPYNAEACDSSMPYTGGVSAHSSASPTCHTTRCKKRRGNNRLWCRQILANCREGTLKGSNKRVDLTKGASSDKLGWRHASLFGRTPRKQGFLQGNIRRRKLDRRYLSGKFLFT